MYRIIKLLILSTSFLIAEFTSIAVLDFEGKGISDSEASILTDRLRDELIKSDNYNVLERSLMEDILNEQGLQQTGICNSSDCAVEIGNMLGVEQLLGGSIGKIGSLYTISARIIEVETGKIINSANYDHDGNIEDLVTVGMKDISNILLAKSGLLLENEIFSKNIRYLNSENVFSFLYLNGNYAMIVSKQLDNRANASIGFTKESGQGINNEDSFDYPSFGDLVRYSKSTFATSFSFYILKNKSTLINPLIGANFLINFFQLENLTKQKSAKTNLLTYAVNLGNRVQIFDNAGISFGFLIEYTKWLDFDVNDKLYAVKPMLNFTPVVTFDIAIPNFF